MTSILSKLPYDMKADEADFSKDLLLLMLKEYELFVDSFQYACKNFKGNTEDATIAKVMGFESIRNIMRLCSLGKSPIR